MAFDHASFTARQRGLSKRNEALHLEEAMFRASFFATVLCAIAVGGPALAMGLGEAGELEHARANARAGGPLSDRDAELLQRYGCLSGTDSAFCKRLSRQARPNPTHRRRPKK
jgi:hypothetical protein